MIGYPGLNIHDYVGEGPVSELVLDNALDLLARVEDLLLALDWPHDVHITSGYRSPARNKKVGGKPKSWHQLGRAIDLADPHHELYELIASKSEFLSDYGLWLEDGATTKTWVHLDTGIRRERPVHIFKP